MALYLQDTNIYTTVMKVEDKALIQTMQQMFDYFKAHSISVTGSDVKFLVEAAEMLVLYPDMEALVAVLSKLPDNRLTANHLATLVDFCKLKILEMETMWRGNDLTSGYAALFSVIEELVCKQQDVTQKMLTPAMLLVSLEIAKHMLYTPALKLLVTTLSEVYDFRERTGLNKLSSRELVPYLQIRYAEYCSGTRNAVQAEEAVGASCSSNASEVLCGDIYYLEKWYIH